MGRGLSRSLDPVMTGRTGAWFDPQVPEGYAGPGNSPVAIVTRHRRLDVRSGFPLHHVVVVARRTTSRRYTIMSEEGWPPIGCAMATITVHCRRQMVDRLESGDDSSAGGMALHTLRRGSPKDALQVTPLAHHLGVAPAERETGTTMINSNVRAVTSLGRRRLRHHQHRAAYRQKPGNNYPGKELVSCQVRHPRHSCIRHCARSSGCAIYIH